MLSTHLFSIIYIYTSMSMSSYSELFLLNSFISNLMFKRVEKNVSI